MFHMYRCSRILYYIITIFLLSLGFITIPTIATGMFVGGYITKRFKLSLLGIAKYLLSINIVTFAVYLLNFALICESKSVAGLTLTYDGFVYINLSVAQCINYPV